MSGAWTNGTGTSAFRGTWSSLHVTVELAIGQLVQVKIQSTVAERKRLRSLVMDF